MWARAATQSYAVEAFQAGDALIENSIIHGERANLYRWGSYDTLTGTV